MDPKASRRSEEVYITLIPKHPNVIIFGHYRLINLCTMLYKVCAKILVGRLKPIVPHLIFSEQEAFVSDYRITNNFLLAQEFIYTTCFFLMELQDNQARCGVRV